MPLVGMSGKIMKGAGGNRLGVMINEPVNRFVGIMNNLWSNPANWSLGMLPSSNQIAIIENDCLIINVSAICRKLVINEGVTLQVTSIITVNEQVEGGGLLQVNHAGQVTLYANIAAQTSLSLIGTTNIRYFSADELQEIKKPLIGTYANLYLKGYNKRIDYTIVVSNLLQTEFVNGQTSNIISDFLLSEVRFKNVNINTQNGNGSVFSGIKTENLIFTGTVKNSQIAGISATNVQKITFLGKTKIESGSNGGNFTIVPPIYVEENTELLIESVGGFPVLQGNIYGMSATSVLKFKSQNDSRYAQIYSESLFPSGVLDLSENNANISYIGAGNQSIRVPDVGSYNLLRLEGSGVKQLKGNISCDHLYIGGTASVDENGFSLNSYTKYTDGRSQPIVPSNRVYDSVNFLNLGSNATRVNLVNITSDVIYSSSFWNGYILTNVECNLWIFERGLWQTLPPFGIFSNIRLSGAIQGGSLTKNLEGNISVTGTTFISAPFTAEFGYYETRKITTLNLNIDFNGDQYLFLSAIIFTNMSIFGTGIKTLTKDIVITGTYYRNPVTVINKNGFTIKDGNGNDLE